MYLVNNFCRDVCPYANAEKYPEIKICKILDGLSNKEDCPAHMFARYISHRIACVGIHDSLKQEFKSNKLNFHLKG